MQQPVTVTVHAQPTCSLSKGRTSGEKGVVGHLGDRLDWIGRGLARLIQSPECRHVSFLSPSPSFWRSPSDSQCTCRRFMRAHMGCLHTVGDPRQMPLLHQLSKAVIAGASSPVCTANTTFWSLWQATTLP
jgi:hypothetical protein